MNYIKKIQKENVEKTAEITAMRAKLVEMETYLLSPKFFSDPTVQISDILTRLTELKSTH